MFSSKSIQQSWNLSEIVAYLIKEKFDETKQHFSTYSPKLKMKILLSFLLFEVDQVASNIESIDKIILSVNKNEEWTYLVMLLVVKLLSSRSDDLRRKWKLGVLKEADLVDVRIFAQCRDILSKIEESFSKEDSDLLGSFLDMELLYSGDESEIVCSEQRRNDHHFTWHGSIPNFIP